MDSRNSNITHKIFDVLNNTKGFEVAMGSGATGKLIINYKGTNFSVVIDPYLTIMNTEEWRIINHLKKWLSKIFICLNKNSVLSEDLR